ncbi:MAG: hypothetical protein HY683_01030 [Chloroflexi bacterium]|nr:hypothetical protein [Chloroflexota bacterium]
MLMLTTALDEESRGILTAGQWTLLERESTWSLYRGDVSAQEALLLVTGVGRQRVVAAMETVLPQYHPEALLSLGYAGALQPGLAAGPLVVAERVLHLEEGPAASLGAALEPDSGLLKQVLAAAEGAMLAHRLGPLLTAERIVATSADKRDLGSLTGALAVDMETYWAGVAAGQAGTPFAAVRAVVDTLEQSLPPVFQGGQGPDLRRGALRWALAHPWQAWRLVGLARGASAARQSLRALVLALLAPGSAERSRAD